MTQIETKHSNKMGFGFESDATASFLVIKCVSRVVEYQALMLEHNRIRHVIPVDVVIKEGVTCLYYNITSKISLSFFLNRRKFERKEFLRLLLHITSAVNDSAGFLLEDSNFIFNPEYVYICPETLEPALIYVPISQEAGGRVEMLQGFISDLVLQHINVEGFGSGNFVQRILASVNSEVFHIKGLITLLNELLHGQEPCECDAGEAECKTGEGQSGETLWKNKKVGKRGKKIDGTNDTEGTVTAEGRAPWLAVLAILVQIVMGGVIYLSRGFLNNASENPTATYAATAMIVLAIEVLLIKRIFAAKLINLETGHENTNSDADADADAVNILEQVCEGPACIANEAAAELAAASAELTKDSVKKSKHIFCKTELLGSHMKSARFLKSTGKQIGDEDIIIDKDDYIIGRLAGHVDHALTNNAVGKLHAQLICRDGSCYIKDLNSVNGTFINNKRIESNKEFELKENDKLQLANSEFVFYGG